MIRVPRWKILATMVFCAAFGSLATWGLSAQADHVPVRSVYLLERGGGIERLVVRGEGCLMAEDMTRLRLTEWDPATGRVIYRCVQP